MALQSHIFAIESPLNRQKVANVANGPLAVLAVPGSRRGLGPGGSARNDADGSVGFKRPRVGREVYSRDGAELL